MGLGGIVGGQLLCCLLAYLIARNVLLRATNWRDWGKTAFVISLMAMFLLALMGAASAERQSSFLRANFEILTTLDEVREAELLNQMVLVEAVVSAENDSISTHNEVITADSFLSNDIWVDVAGGSISMSLTAAEELNWRNAAGRESLHYRDPIIVFGRPYLGRIRDKDALDTVFIDADVVYRGGRKGYQETVVPQLQRNATYAQIVATVGLVLALIVILVPLYQAMQLWRERRE